MKPLGTLIATLESKAADRKLYLAVRREMIRGTSLPSQRETVLVFTVDRVRQNLIREHVPDDNQSVTVNSIASYFL